MIDVLWLALRLVVAAVLMVSAIGKRRDLSGFADAIGRYRLLPGSVVAPVAYLLTAAEILIAALLVLGVAAAFWLAAGLFLLFGTAIGSALGRRLAIPCGCFGGDDVVSRIALVRVGLLVAASAAGVSVGFSGPARLVGGWDLPMAATIAVGGLILGRLVLLVPDARAALGREAATPSVVALIRDPR